MDPTPPSPDENFPPPLERIVEAMLFIGGAPLTVPRACEAIRGLTPEQFSETVAQLNLQYRRQARPYTITRRDEGYELAVRPAFRGVREKLFGGQREARLSQPALDTLALVAYRQPIARQELDSLRGGDSLSSLRQLVRFGLIAVQRGQSDSQEVQYTTTPRFLRLFGLRNLEDLPRAGEPRKM